MEPYMIPLMHKHTRTRKPCLAAWRVQISTLSAVLFVCGVMVYHHHAIVVRQRCQIRNTSNGPNIDDFPASHPIRHAASSSHLNAQAFSPQAVAYNHSEALPRHSLCGNLSISDISGLIPSNIIYMQKRWEYTMKQWQLAIAWLHEKDPGVVQNICTGGKQQQRILMYFGSFIHSGLTGLNGLPQGEHIQWHDLHISLLLTGYHPVLLSQSTPLTSELLGNYDIVITDYNGVAHALNRNVLEQHKCKLRILDSYGTDRSYNMKEKGGPYCCLHLDLKQFWTFMPGFSPDNDFLGYTVRSFRQLDEAYPEQHQGQLPSQPQRRNEVLLYGKEYQFAAGDHDYIQQLMQFAPTHATAMGWPQGVLPGVQNHGVQSSAGLHALMSKTFAYAGFPSVLMGPAAMEAISQGMVFLNYAMDPPWNLSKRQGKPTTQLWSSQFPFLEAFEPHVITINPKNKTHVAAQLAKVQQTYERWWLKDSTIPQRVDSSMQVLGHVFLAKTRGQRTGFVPFEYATVAMLQWVDRLMQWPSCLTITR